MRLKKIYLERKSLYGILAVLVVFIFSLTIAYAALSVTLNIVGNAEVAAGNWDIHFANPVVDPYSVTTDVPIITGGNSLSFTTTLSKPGDYYLFLVDVVNDGTIDAMIDSIDIKPELTAEQEKYLYYFVIYENGESIESKQNLAAGKRTRIMVILEYRWDLEAGDLPITSEELTFSIKLNYTQADDTSIDVPDNGVIKVATTEGSLDAVGTLVTIDDQQFYTIGTEGDNVKLLSMYNLHAGNMFDRSFNLTPLSYSSGIQSSDALGAKQASDGNYIYPHIGVISYSDSKYWSGISSYPADVYSTSSNLYTHIEYYKEYIQGYGIPVVEARPIKYSELTGSTIGCTDPYCNNAPNFIYSTVYWTGTAADANSMYVINNGRLESSGNDINDRYGIRPVIVVPKSIIYGTDEEMVEFTINGVPYSVVAGTTWEEWINDTNYLNLLLFDNQNKDYICKKKNRNGCISLDGETHAPIRYSPITNYDYTIVYYPE